MRRGRRVPWRPIAAGTPRRAAAPDRELFSAADVARTVARIAHQIIEKTAFGPDNPDDLVIVGIPTGGAVLARRLAAAIAEFTGVTPAVGTVDPTLYRDDLRRGPARPLGDTALPDGGLDDRLVVLVDDVLFSGRTVRAALDALRDHGRPRAVQLAVLVDRGHRELPIRADYVGKNVPTAPRRVDRRAADRDRRPRRGGAAPRRESAERGGRAREAPAVGRPTWTPRRRDRRCSTPRTGSSRRCWAARSRKLPTLRGRTVVTMFYENSTRTRVSFEVAGKWMSADTINVSASGSSVGKGESPARHRARRCAAIGADCIVVRHPASGAAHRMAHWATATRRRRVGPTGPGSATSVVNAGDGTHEHPTQALLDARDDAATGSAGSTGGGSAIVGDVLHSRVARSNVFLLATLGAEVVLVGAADAAAGRRRQAWPCRGGRRPRGRAARRWTR